MMRIAVGSISLLLLVASLVTAPAAHAQQEERSEAERSAALGQITARVGNAWSEGDAAAIAALSSAEGIAFDLDLEDESVAPVAEPRAAAMLRRLLRKHRTLDVEFEMVQVVGGEPARGFGTLTWNFRTEGTTATRSRIIFLAAIEQDDGWRLTEIRLLQ